MKMNFKILLLKTVLIMFISLFFSQASMSQTTTKKVTQDSVQTIQDIYLHTRGLQYDKKDGDETFRKIANSALFLPRICIDGLLYSFGSGANYVEESNIILRAENFLYFYNKTLGWYPKIKYSSDYKLAVGAAVFYKHSNMKYSIGAYYANRNYWDAKISSVYIFRNNGVLYNINLSGQTGAIEEMKFYGYGHNPLQDSRNAILNPNKKYGTFNQERSKIQLVTGAQISSLWEFFYTAFYSKRKLLIPDPNKTNTLVNVFDLETLPGIINQSNLETEQLYNEFSCRFDTRSNVKELSPGIRLEGYWGYATGMNMDKSQFIRTGFDAAFYIPVILRNRLIVPRILFDSVHNQNENFAIPFTEYMRQPAFRGVSSRHLLRTDNYSMVTSLEYQWPLTQHFRGHIFYDMLLVSQELKSLTLHQNPYAIGIGFDLNQSHSEISRVSLTTGSEGFRFILTMGLSETNSYRSNWK